MNVMPDQNKPITIYSISSLNISSGSKMNEKELPVAYFFYNMDGKIIQSGKVSPSNNIIDLTNRANGTYIVQLKNTQSAFTYRVIK